MISLNQTTADSTVVLKTGYRQTKAFFAVWQTLSFQSMEYHLLVVSISIDTDIGRRIAFAITLLGTW